MSAEGGTTVPRTEIDVQSIPIVKERLLNNLETGGEANMRPVLRDIYFLESKGVFNEDPQYREMVEECGQDPTIWTGVYVSVRDRVNVLQSHDISDKRKDQITVELKGLYHIAEITKMDAPPQYFKDVWEDIWKFLNSNSDKIALQSPASTTPAEVKAQTDRQQLPTSDVGSSPNDVGTRTYDSDHDSAPKAGVRGPLAPEIDQMLGEEADQKANWRLYMEKVRNIARAKGISEVEAVQLIDYETEREEAEERGDSTPKPQAYEPAPPSPQPPANPNPEIRREDTSIIVEREPGGDFVRLDNYLKEKGGKLPEAEALEIGIKIGEYFATIHSQGIDDQLRHWDWYGIKSIYWDPGNKQLRLKRSLSDNKHYINESNGILFAGGEDRYELAKLMFRLTTGLALSRRGPSTNTPEEYLRENGYLGFANFVEPLYPRPEEIMEALQPFSEGLKNVLVKALFPSLAYKNASCYSGLAADTKLMLLDLILAYKALKGESVSEQMLSYYREAEHRRQYLIVLNQMSHPRFVYMLYNEDLDQNRENREIINDIDERMKDQPIGNYDPIIKVVLGSYNFNLDKALESQ